MVSYLGDGITFPIATHQDIKAAGIAIPVIGFVILLLRSLSHCFKQATPGFAELFGVISWIFLAAMGGVLVWGAEHHSLGWPTPPGPDLTMKFISTYQKRIQFTEYYIQIFMAIVLGTTKLSILFFFRKIFITQKRNIWNYLTWALIAIVTLWTLAMTLNLIFWCGADPAAYWADYTSVLSKCESVVGANFSKAWAISDMVLDLLCILLPFPIIWRLQLSTKLKISITGIFLVGLMTLAANIARLVLWIQVLDTAADPTEDVNLAIAVCLQWGIIESGLAFYASQLPALSVYLTKTTRDRVADSMRNLVLMVSLNRSADRSGHHDLEIGGMSTKGGSQISGTDYESDGGIRKTTEMQVERSY